MRRGTGGSYNNPAEEGTEEEEGVLLTDLTSSPPAVWRCGGKTSSSTEPFSASFSICKQSYPVCCEQNILSLTILAGPYVSSNVDNVADCLAQQCQNIAFYVMVQR